LPQWLSQGPSRDQQLTCAGAIGAALAKLHAAGVEHPDLNLNNILIEPDEGKITLIDFDRARRRRTSNPLQAACNRLQRSATRLVRPEVDGDFLAALRDGAKPRV